MSDPRDAAPEERPGPPEFPEIEQQLIGMVLARDSLFESVADVVEPQHFVEESFGRIWGVLQDMHRRNMPMAGSAAVEPIANELGWPRGETVRTLGVLVKRVTTLSMVQAQYCAATIRDVWVRREIWDVAQQMTMRTRGGLDNSGATIIEEAEAKLFELSNDRTESDHTATLGDAMMAGIEQAQAAVAQHQSGKLVGVPSGLGGLDRKLGGFRSPDLIVVGGATSQGKTAWALKVSRAAAEYFVSENPERPKWVLYFSMEMAADQLGTRIACTEAGVSFEKVRLGHSSVENLMELEKAKTTLDALPMLIDETASITTAQMRVRARRLMRKKGLGLIVVDYLQLINPSRDELKKSGNNRAQVIGLITRNLKELAKDLNVPVIALCQLSRAIEQREDKRPMLSDLRESGDIEMASDVVGFLFREHYYMSKRAPVKRDRETDLDLQQRVTEWQANLDRIKNHAEFILGKHRHGSLGTVLLDFIAELMDFRDREGEAGPDGKAERAHQYRMEIDDRIT